MRTSLLTACALALAACATTPAERAAQMQAQVDEMIQVYGPACEKLGYAKDSERWRDCILKLDTNERLYTSRPTTTSCFGHRGFFQCNTF